MLSCVQFFATPWFVECQVAPLSMGFSRQEYWSASQFPPPGDLPDTGIKPKSPAVPAFQADFLPLSHWGSPGRYEGEKKKCCLFEDSEKKNLSYESTIIMLPLKNI